MDVGVLRETVTEDITLDAFESRTKSEAEPAKGVFVWRPDGAPCDGCGAVVSGRWRASESWYCESCVTWEQS